MHGPAPEALSPCVWAIMPVYDEAGTVEHVRRRVLKVVNARLDHGLDEVARFLYATFRGRSPTNAPLTRLDYRAFIPAGRRAEAGGSLRLRQPVLCIVRRRDDERR